jgi:ATP-dependent Clp protease ATP-binding subunit ClpC
MFDRFTDRARKVMALANQEVQRLNHDYIGTEHILLGLVKEGSGVGASVLKNLGVDLRGVRREVEQLIKHGPEMVTMGKVPQTPRAKRVIEYALEESRDLNHNYVGTEHLLLGLLREQEGVAAQVLTNMGVSLDLVRREVLQVLVEGVGPRESGVGAEVVSYRTGPDVARQILLALLTELEACSGRATESGDRELGAAYGDLLNDARALLDKLNSMLKRRRHDDES